LHQKESMRARRFSNFCRQTIYQVLACTLFLCSAFFDSQAKAETASDRFTQRARSYQPPKQADLLRKIREAQNGLPMMSVSRISGNYVRWNGCNRSVVMLGTMGDNGRDPLDPKCPSSDLSQLNPQFAAHLQRYLYFCVARAAQAAGISRPAFVTISSMSTFSHRYTPSGQLSNHASGRALDIGMFTLFDASGEPIKIPGPRPPRVPRGGILAHAKDYQGNDRVKSFYDDFRVCWKQSQPQNCDGTGSIGCRGSAEPNNAAHDNHIHLELSPSCG